MKCKNCGENISLWNNNDWWHKDGHYTGYRYCFKIKNNMFQHIAEPNLKYYRKLKLDRINEM
jgi:hypothetical protein